MSPFDEAQRAGPTAHSPGSSPAPDAGPGQNAADDDFCNADPLSGKGPAAIERFLADLWLLRDQAAVFLLARQDQLKLRVRRAIVVAAIGLLALAALATILVAAAALIVTGIARGLGDLFGHLWLGELVTGVGVLVLCGLGIYALVQRMIRVSRSHTANRYAELHQQQSDRRRANAAKSAADHAGK